MVAVELEVMAKKMDRFGWERDRGTMAHDRAISDWMDALQDYPLAEVQDACKAHVVEFPRKMANEGDVLYQLRKLRKAKADEYKLRHPAQEQPKKEPCTPEAAAEILASVGFSPRKMDAK